MLKKIAIILLPVFLSACHIKDMEKTREEKIIYPPVYLVKDEVFFCYYDIYHNGYPVLGGNANFKKTPEAVLKVKRISDTSANAEIFLDSGAVIKANGLILQETRKDSTVYGKEPPFGGSSSDYGVKVAYFINKKKEMDLVIALFMNITEPFVGEARCVRPETLKAK